MIHDSVQQSEQTPANLKLACYGWDHAHWAGHYYPDDLPEDWRLAYYANDYGGVLVPAEYCLRDDIGDWLDEVDEDFRFYFEWPDDAILQTAVVAACEILRPQVAAVLTDQSTLNLNVEVFYLHADNAEAIIWRPGQMQSSTVGELENIQAVDLRQQRCWLEAFYRASGQQAKHLIIKDVYCNHQQLSEMSKLIELLSY